MDLGIDDAELATCVACGLCLPHCPTYRVTGEEALSPRGRVAGMRQVQWEGSAVDDSFVRSMETCVQCRGCETACPSGVPFGHLIEPTRATLAEGRPATSPSPDAGLTAPGFTATPAPPGGTPASTPPGVTPAPPPVDGTPAPTPVDGTPAPPPADGTPAPTPPGVTPAPTPADGAPPRTTAGVRPAPPHQRPPIALRLALRALRWHRLVLAGSSALAVAQRLRLVPPRLSRRLGLPARLPIRRPRLAPTGAGADTVEDVWLFTGCVMDAWMRDVHADVQRVVEAAGGRVGLPGSGAACCGALAQHAGLASEAHAVARRTMRALPGEAPILVDAAGCGAMLREYGRVLGTPEARAFSARVRDVHEWLAPRVDRVVAAASLPADGRRRASESGPAEAAAVAVQDPCHLRHVQRAHGAVRTVLSPFATLVELDDEGLCCGAGGAYAAVQPELAAAIRERKLAAIERSGAAVVTSANPGCALHLAAAGVEVVHPCQIVARAFGAETR